MRIELNTGGLSSGAVISGFQTDFSSLQSKSQSMISAFQAVKSFVHSMNGGVGTLQGAVDQISSRQSSEDAKSSKLNEVASKANGFVELSRRIDLEVGGMVNQNKNEFYDVNPWSRPPKTEEEKKWYQKAWEWGCQKVEQVKEGFSNLKDAVVSWGKAAADSLRKVWQSIKEFCASDLGKLILGIVAVVGAVLLMCAIPALVPMLGAMLTTWGMAASTAAIVASAVGATCMISTGLALIPNTMDTLAAADRVIGLGGGINATNNQLHQSALWNGFQKTTNTISFLSSIPLSAAGIWGSVNGISAETARQLNAGNYSSSEMKELVQGFKAAKKAAPAVNQARIDNAGKVNAPKNKAVSRAQELSFEKSMPGVDTQIKVSGTNSGVSTTLDGFNKSSGNILELKSSMTSTYTKPQQTLFGVKNTSSHPSFNVSHTTEALTSNSGLIIPHGTPVITIYQQPSYVGIKQLTHLLSGPTINGINSGYQVIRPIPGN